MPARVIEHLGLRCYSAGAFICEGGGISVDGEGTLITTEAVMLNPNRYSDSSREDVERSARMVNADAFIRNLPKGYDTVLQERGGGLSLGQKQLLVLARTVAQDPDMLFVLDEATASVDTETEQLIQDALNTLMKTRTSLIVAHRLSTIRHVNRILVRH